MRQRILYPQGQVQQRRRPPPFPNLPAPRRHPRGRSQCINIMGETRRLLLQAPMPWDADPMDKGQPRFPTGYRADQTYRFRPISRETALSKCAPTIEKGGTLGRPRLETRVTLGSQRSSAMQERGIRRSLTVLQNPGQPTLRVWRDLGTFQVLTVVHQHQSMRASAIPERLAGPERLRIPVNSTKTGRRGRSRQGEPSVSTGNLTLLGNGPGHHPMAALMMVRHLATPLQLRPRQRRHPKRRRRVLQ